MKKKRRAGVKSCLFIFPHEGKKKKDLFVLSRAFFLPLPHRGTEFDMPTNQGTSRRRICVDGAVSLGAPRVYSVGYAEWRKWFHKKKKAEQKENKRN